jgi:GNAT superfamily N-acetyltransferase
MILRPWHDDDALAVASLLDADSDPLWAMQGHRLHGSARDGQRWRRTLVACDQGRVIGAGTLVRNSVHGGSYPCAVEVAADRRRKGVATALIRALRDLRPQPLPLSGKVRERDRAAWPFGQAMGCQVYQRCPCPRLDPAAAAAWCLQNLAGTARLTSMSELPAAQAAQLFQEQYRWVHERWSPVTSTEWLSKVAAATVAEANLAASSCCWQADGVTAAVFAFIEPDGSASLVAETQHREEVAGTALLSAAVARSLTVLAEQGCRTVEFDGHDDDPHLAPIVAQLPVTTTNPLLLVRLR